MWLAIDTETTGLNLLGDDEVFAVSACDQDGRSYFWEWPVKANRKVFPIPSDVEEITALIQSADDVVFFNAKFDLVGLRKLGIDVAKLKSFLSIQDVALATHILDSKGPRDLKQLSLLHCDILDTDEKALATAVKSARLRAKHNPNIVLGESWEADMWLPKFLNPEDITLSVYAITDAVRTACLWQSCQQALRERGEDYKYYRREVRLIPIIMAMEQRGIAIDLEQRELERTAYESQLNKHNKVCIDIAASHGMRELNLRSPVQLRTLMFDKLKLPVVAATKTGMPSTDKNALIELLESYSDSDCGPGPRFLRSLVEVRQWTKAIEYLDEYYEKSSPEKCGRATIRAVHSSINQVGTDTTRFSSSGPNMQNVSKKTPLRSVFVPRPGYSLYSADYDQVELRIIAFASRDERMMDWFERGVDIHAETGKLFFGESDDPTEAAAIRRAGKTLNFAICYGATVNKVASITKNTRGYYIYKELFPGVAKLMSEIGRQVESDGFIRIATGRPLSVDASKPYTGLNYFCQGTAGDLIKQAMRFIWQYNHRHGIQDRAHLLLNIHDELVFEIHDNLPNKGKVLRAWKNLMEKPGRTLGIATPASFSIMLNRWSESQELELSRYV